MASAEESSRCTLAAGFAFEPAPWADLLVEDDVALQPASNNDTENRITVPKWMRLGMK
jgi:hypothetical protein